MRDHIILRRIRLVMANLNVLWLVFYGWLLFFTTRKIIWMGDATAFIRRLNGLPLRPEVTLTWTMGLALGLMLMIHLREALCRTVGPIVFYSMEILMGLGLIALTGYGYNAIMLILAAEILVADFSGGWKLAGTALYLIIYIISDTRLVLFMDHRIPLDRYLDYIGNGKGVISTMQSLITVGTSLTFLFYLVLSIRLTGEENRQIRQLNRELDEANDNLRQANLRLEEYAQSVEEMSQTRERNRLAREIHDTLGHTLTGIISGLDACLTLMDFSPEETRRLLEKTAAVARNGMNDVRRTVNALRPDALENRSLETAIHRLVAERQEISQVEVNCTMDLQGLHLADDEEETIYRIVQESMTNAVAHGKASRIDIDIGHTGHRMTIYIVDNGVGCPDFKPDYGLIHMQERIHMLKGDISFNGHEGFRVNAWFPVRRTLEGEYERG